MNNKRTEASTSTSVFAKYEKRNYPHQFRGTLLALNVFGGTPTDPRVAEGWLRTKLADNDDLIRQAVAETMLERNIGVEEATALVDIQKHLNGFRRDSHGLYLEGRCLKACLKESASVAGNSGRIDLKKWGLTGKGLINWFPEHVFVVEDRLYLGVTEPSGIDQSFVHTWRGNGIQYAEYVDEAKISFTIETDYDFSEEQWAAIWLTAQRIGIGSSRSQGRGRFEVVAWERL